ncbi:MAG: universal stress protein [Lentimicrobium sp.]|jgi:nucleotide-binding universal stress UspA family protein|nr:universal stress protein [Lentimicrobium sp.]MDD4597950.1 universal stress protein [Lentimicrobiaceae bacterium]MDY0024536.1 universal stress protein [Lentimicrobium sp.]HAH58085.1 universal stress protein [Bacteroidales bacterium]
MKKVMIALDYDPIAQKVAESGFKLAQTMGAEVTLLHVVTNVKYYSTTGVTPIIGFTDHINAVPLFVEKHDDLKDRTSEFLTRTKNYLGDESINILIKEGDLADTILDTAKELNADLIVMGSHSRRWLDNILMGSVTEKVLKKTEIPLFIVPLRQSQES